MRGFVLRVLPSGRASYYALPRRGVWRRLGNTETLTPIAAREAARVVLAKPALDKAFGRAPDEGPSVPAMLFDTFAKERYTPWATAQRPA